MKKLLYLLTVSVVILLLAACNNDESTSDISTTTQEEKSQKLEVYTTVYPLSYFVERIGGEYVEVTSIYPPGSNEHTFEPTQKDRMNLADADLFFYIGLVLEGFVENAKETLAQENVKFVPTADTLSEEHLHTSVVVSQSHKEHGHDDHGHDDHHHGDIDPHVWLSPVIANELALAIKEELVLAFPEQEQLFTENYNLLNSELVSLHNDFEQMATEAASKTFFVSHASFGYIAGEYGLEQVSVAGLNSQSEPSQKELAEIVDLAKELDIRYILFEQNVSSKLASVIQNEIGADTLKLHNLSVLTEDDIQNEETYISLMEKNIEIFKQALNP